MKSATLALVGVLSCILIAGCVQTREANVPGPPATTYQVGSFELQGSGSPQKIRGASVTHDFFQSEKIPTLLGRGFLPEEYGSGRQQVVVVSHRLWQQRFSEDPRIIGTTMRLNGQAFYRGWNHASVRSISPSSLGAKGRIAGSKVSFDLRNSAGECEVRVLVLMRCWSELGSSKGRLRQELVSRRSLSWWKLHPAPIFIDSRGRPLRDWNRRSL